VARLIFLPLLFAAVSSIGLLGQQGTDFSGIWVLEGGTASADTPARLTVQQPITTTTRRGDPMPPAYLTLTVTRHFANTAQEATYMIGTGGGVVGGLAGRPVTTSSERSVRWRDNALWIEQWNLAAGVVTSARTEIWRLDERGRLIVTLEIREGEKVERGTRAYRRDGAGN
jgi:hypothetical protein